MRLRLLSQFAFTLLVLAHVPGNAFKVLWLLPLWWLTFQGLRQREVIAFFVINSVFVLADIGAIRNGVFAFSKPDLWGLPYYEFFMWGFYLLHLHRMWPARAPETIELKTVVLAGLFGGSFALIQNPTLLLASTSTLLGLSLLFNHRNADWVYTFYLMAMGGLVEWVGLTQGLWSYPSDNLSRTVAQFLVMWGGTGHWFRLLLSRWVMGTTTPGYKRRVLLYGQGCVSPPDFSDSDTHIAEGNLRLALESLRDHLPRSSAPLDRADIFLRLSRVYRMMILMQNAQLELKRAFQELGLQMPRPTYLGVLWSLVRYGAARARRAVPPAEGVERRRVEMIVALYEEAGLSAYYYRQPASLLQCVFHSRGPAERLGPSVQLINWWGGGGCALATLGFEKKGRQLLDRASLMAQSLSAIHPLLKYRLWEARFFEYSGRPLQATETFQTILTQEGLPPHDRLLVTTTLACNLLLRGRMTESAAAIETLTAREVPRSRLLSRGKAFVDWYRLGALAFLGRFDEARDILNHSQIVFFRIDEERWQITQFLGEALVYYYVRPETPVEEIQQCFERFNALGLSPRTTYLEAAHYLVARAHLLLSMAERKQTHWSNAMAAVGDLKHAPRHPSVRAHWNIARAKTTFQTGRTSQGDAWCAEAVREAAQFDNPWVLFEAHRYQAQRAEQEGDGAGAESHRRNAETLARSLGWNGWLR